MTVSTFQKGHANRLDWIGLHMFFQLAPLPLTCQSMSPFCMIYFFTLYEQHIFMRQNTITSDHEPGILFANFTCTISPAMAGTWLFQCLSFLYPVINVIRWLKPSFISSRIYSTPSTPPFCLPRNKFIPSPIDFGLWSAIISLQSLFSTQIAKCCPAATLAAQPLLSWLQWHECNPDIYHRPHPFLFPPPITITWNPCAVFSFANTIFNYNHISDVSKVAVFVVSKLMLAQQYVITPFYTLKNTIKRSRRSHGYRICHS